MKRITEKRDVQDQLINYLTGIGWQFIPQGDFKTDQWRGMDEANPFLMGILQEQLAKLNGWALGDVRIAEVIRQLRTLSPTLAGHESYVRWLRGHKTTYDPTQQREFNVALIDYDDHSRNVYHFTEEMWFSDRDRRRMDMVLYVNGLPVLLIENKNPTSQDPGMEGFHQVQTTYTEKIPEFLKYPVPFAVPAVRLEYGATWNPSTKAFYRWKTDDGRDFGLEKLSKSFFDKRMVLALIRDYTIFYRNDDSVQKFLLRPHQIRTIEKIIKRVVAGQHDLSAPDTGLEWHTQGSGKTLSMIVTAHLLRRDPQMENPTLIILVDRTELEAQMVQNLEAFGYGTVYNPSSINHLRHLLKSDTRGLIVTTIHKFHDMPADIITRRNVVILIDEAHRSQEGDLGIYLNAALPNAFRFGFTGTPIDRGKVGSGTFEMFGKHDQQGYHDKYSINESVEDNTTIPLYYTLAPSEIWVDKVNLEQDYGVMLDEFLQQIDDEGIASIDALNRLLKKADKLMAVLKSPERINAIAQHISTHFVENVLTRGFKAMVVTPDREACVLYKAALDKVLPEPEWSVVVYSGDHKDNDALRQHHLDEDEEKRIRKAFRDPQKSPKILIVTEKLLTGYDAPIAYVMYLDKPLRDHTLLQAIARVNRPYDGKENGLIVDYIGIFENLQRAISFDPESLSKGLIDLEQLKKGFGDLLAQIQEQLAPIQLDVLEGRTDRLIEYFFEDERRDAFVQNFKQLQTAYETLSPDAFLRPYTQLYAELADSYRMVVSYFDPKGEERRLNRELHAKTEKLISDHIGTTKPVSELPLYPINENIADVIKADNVADQVKVINLHRSITVHIEERQEEQPYLLSIGDEVERIIERLRDRQISTETAIRELQSKADEIVDAQHERDASSLDNLAFSLRMVMRAHGASDADTLATQLSGYLHANDGWRFNEAIKRTVKTELYRLILPVLPESSKAQVKTIADELLRMHAITA